MSEWFLKNPVAVIVGIVVIAAVLTLVQARQEARTFNKLTHRADVTTWDALWVSLRVDCTPVP